MNTHREIFFKVTSDIFVLERNAAPYSARVTVLEGIQKSADFLTKKGIESSRLQVELLLAHILKLPRMKLYLNFELALTDAETNLLRELVRRRGQREPLQHIIGSTSFCGLEITVNRQVLVPRPETELLAEAGWQFLASIDSRPTSALDFGTGSGCIAIALAVHCPGAEIIAIDTSAEALELAGQNSERNKVAGRIQFLAGDGFSALRDLPGDPPRAARFDLIVSNPPYIASTEIETLDPEVRDYDPRRALDGGADGLDFFRLLATEARSFLKPDGRTMVEFGDGQADAIIEIFTAQKWIVEALRDDYTQRQRILIARN